MQHAAKLAKKEFEEVDVIVKVPVNLIRPNPDQPRKEFDNDKLHELRAGMCAEGQMVPIFIRPSTIPGQTDRYDIVDGERRWRAASMEGSGIEYLNCIIKDCDDENQFIRSCALNYNREGHTPYEELMMCHKLVRHHKLSMNYVGNLLGKGPNWVSQRLLAYDRLDKRVLEQVKQDKIPITVAKNLSKLKPTDQVKEMNKFLDGGKASDTAVAVRKATDMGNVQGSVKKSTLSEDRRYVERSVEVLRERFRRHKVIGPDRMVKVLTSVGPEDRVTLAEELEIVKQQIDFFIKMLEKPNGR